MSSYRRNRAGRVFFFTVVTHERRPILTTELGRQTLREAIGTVRRDRPFVLTAIVLLPDHLHAIWELPPGDSDYSTRWRRIKSLFTKGWLAGGGEAGTVNRSRSKREEQGIWQRRFFEHTCRDDEDLKRCLDYVHINPVKHGLVTRVADWPWSSFHRYVRLGEYDVDWGGSPEMYGDEFKYAE
ncbi:Transposase IS200 like protein [Maioricimonas rarisocia]|uniref:Transposase IS200 like protein n=1 Tax=Maioricimonas rarisocia TaxID=2528026 RepID=A0A517Z0Y7_9PLAN|nr:transposase [Maioricimonas rarisocia]QDU36142.1 Transposase IS200 like protein [Maioricimonas rarisocia]